MRAEGITLRRIGQLDGRAEFNHVRFENVRVPAGNLVGELHGGWRVALQTLSSERSRLILHRAIHAEAALRSGVRAIASDFASRGEPVPTLVAQRAGRVFSLVAALLAHCVTLTRRLDSGHGPAGQDSLDKLILTEAEQEVWSFLADCLGPYRMTMKRQPLGLESDHITDGYFYSRSWSISGGTLQVQRNIVAERLLGLAREG
jgi:alkylation response protein AidB-like acyl-CoA dehydrogenase